MVMLYAPTAPECRAVFVLERGAHASEFKMVRGVLESELAHTIDNLMKHRDTEEMVRLQGRAQALKEILNFIDTAHNRVKA